MYGVRITFFRKMSILQLGSGRVRSPAIAWFLHELTTGLYTYLTVLNITEHNGTKMVRMASKIPI